MMDDLATIKRCLNGETDAFRHLVEGYQKQAVGHAVAILGNREDALDAVQEAYVDAFWSLKTFDPARRFYPWFYVLLRNRCYKMTAKRRETESIEETEIIAPSATLPDEERFALERALLALDKNDREIITLKYLDGLSYDEIAERLEIPKGTVMSRLFYARRQLQAKLKGK
ncbi:MAG: RNA polymerase sigma factor [Pyrinomonadaceae bacterium]